MYKVNKSCEINLRRALQSPSDDLLLQGVGGLFNDPVALGYIYGGPIGLVHHFWPEMDDVWKLNFVNSALEMVFTENALVVLNGAFKSLGLQPEFKVGVNLAMRDVQAAISAWAKGMPQGECPKGYLIGTPV
jgi:hypothetical protein